MMTVKRCDSTMILGTCPGHLGKFASCLDEAINVIVSNGFHDDEVGTVEDSIGFNAKVLLKHDSVLETEEEGILVLVPKGAYILHEDSNGFVTVTHGTPEWASARMVDLGDELYDEEDDEDDEDGEYEDFVNLDSDGNALEKSARYSTDAFPGVAVFFVANAGQPGWVHVTMVGDDEKHLVESSGLSRLVEDGYCTVCGQIGCTADGK